MRIIIATQNKNKTKEFKELLTGFEVLSLSDLDDHTEIIEDGNTYLENAQIKVDALRNKYPNDVIIGDDSGFSVKALNHQPGIFSARYMGEKTSQETKNRAILQQLEDVADCQAMFFCAMVLYYRGHYFHTQQVVYGTVALKPMGSDGFGYDPIFIPEGHSVTFAQDHELKKTISHRAKAIQEIVKHVKYLED